MDANTIGQRLVYSPIPIKSLERQTTKMLNGSAINPRRRAEKIEMAQLGFKSRKRYRRWQKDQRHMKKVKAENT